MSHDDDRYLWDKSGPEDPEVKALEDLLGPLGHPDVPVKAAPPLAGPARGRYWQWAAAAVLVLGLGLALWLASRPSEEGPGPKRVPVAMGPDAEAAQDAAPALAPLEPGERVTFAGLGEVRAAAGTRARVATREAELTVVRLDEGELEVAIYADVPPGAFVVETPLAKVVDLGCEYTVRVGEGSLEVKQRLGMVEILPLAGGRAVVPAGAVGRVDSAGVATPLFEDASEALRLAAEAFDASAMAWGGDRTAQARALAQEASTRRDSLPVWHLLGDTDPRVVEIAQQALERLLDARDPAPSGAAEWLGFIRAQGAWD